MFVDLNRYLLQREKFYSSMEKLLHSKDIPVEDRASIIERLATHPRLDALKDYLENELLSQVEDELNKELETFDKPDPEEDDDEEWNNE